MDLRALGERLFRNLVGRIPSWPYLLAAACVAALGHWLSDVEIVEPLRAASATLLADLKVLSPVNAIGVYYDHVAGCSIGIDHSGSGVNCRLSQAIWDTLQRNTNTLFATLIWPALALWQTASTIWDSTDWVGRVIYILTFPIGMFCASEAVDAIGDDDDWSPFGWSLFVVLIPAFAGLTALILQWLLIAIVWIFGMALGAIVWLSAVLAAPFAYFQTALGVVKEARKIEEEHSALKGDAGEAD